jgi:hypothetical protein
MNGGDDSQSYFAAASPPKGNGLDAQLAELKLMQQQLLANRSNTGSPSRGPLLQQQQPIIPTTGAAPYMYVDPRARGYNPMAELQDNQGHDQQYLDRVNNQEMLRRFQLLPADAQKILMNTKALPRYASDKSDLNDMLNSSPETQFLGKPKPTPTPTAVPKPTKYFPVSYFT